MSSKPQSSQNKSAQSQNRPSQSSTVQSMSSQFEKSLSLASQSQRSQGTQSQVLSGSVNSSQVNIEELSSEIVLFLLTSHRSLKPVKKSMLLKHFKGISGKIFNDVMVTVKNKLHNIYGMKLKEVEDKSTCYILVNELAKELNLDILQSSSLDTNKSILMLIILCVIKKIGGRLKEDALLAFLEKADIIENNKKPVGKGIFSEMDVEKFLRQELTGMLYLRSFETRLDIDNTVIEYGWGIRAEEEVSNEKLEEFYKEVDGMEILKNETEENVIEID